MTYDANGNRLTQTGTTAATLNVSSTSNRLVSVTGVIPRTYGFDAAGNTTSYASNTFTYNQRGRMSSATVSGSATNYLYNALGQLIEKSGNGGTTLLMYDESGHLLGEYSSSGALIEETIWLDDLPVATLRPNGSAVTIYYVHTDHLGSARKVTRASDNGLMWRWDFDPFGTSQPNQNPQAQGTFVYNLRFPGQYYQAETGLNYNYFRDYDPGSGRYLESDPIGLAGGQLSTYGYAGANPISLKDPLGLATLVIGSGPIASNPAGHVALAFTGQGVYSYGTPDPYGASTTDYIAAALANRNVTQTVLNTTPAQEEAMRNAYTKNYGPHSKYSIAKGHDCANAALDALTGADALDQQILNLLFNQDAPMLQFLPSTVVSAAFLQPGGTNVFLPQGSTVPANLGSFNK